MSAAHPKSEKLNPKPTPYTLRLLFLCMFAEQKIKSPDELNTGENVFSIKFVLYRMCFLENVFLYRMSSIRVPLTAPRPLPSRPSLASLRPCIPLLISRTHARKTHL